MAQVPKQGRNLHRISAFHALLLVQVPYLKRNLRHPLLNLRHSAPNLRIHPGNLHRLALNLHHRPRNRPYLFITIAKTVKIC